MSVTSLIAVRAMQVMGVWRVTKEASNLREQSERVWLAVSRSFGDLSLKEPTVLVSSVPEVRRYGSLCASHPQLAYCKWHDKGPDVVYAPNDM